MGIWGAVSRVIRLPVMAAVMISFSIGFSLAWLHSYHFEFCNVNDIGVSTRVGLLMPVDSVKSGLATIANLPLETSAAQAPPEDV